MKKTYYVVHILAILGDIGEDKEKELHPDLSQFNPELFKKHADRKYDSEAEFLKALNYNMVSGEHDYVYMEKES
jgi:hypothetical protein